MQARPFYWLTLSYFGFYCSYGVFMPFFPVWLKAQNYLPEAIGFIMASAYIFRFLGSMIFNHFIKEAHQLLTALRYLAWISAFIMIFMSFFIENYILLCLGLWCFSIVSAAAIPLSDTLVTMWQFQVKLDYGRIRLIGSLAFATGVTVFGYLIGLVGEQHIGWIIIALLFVYALIQMLPPSILPETPKEENSDNAEGVPSLWQLLKDPITARIILAVALIQGSHAAYYVYSIIYWKSLGIPVETTSIYWGLSVFGEVLFFFYVTKLFGNWATPTLFYIGAIACAFRWTAFPYAESFFEIVPMQLLHSLTFALSHYTIMRYISTQSPRAIANLQGLYNAAAVAGVALISMLAGYFYPISPKMTFFVMTGFALLAIPFIPRHLPDSVTKVKA